MFLANKLGGRELLTMPTPLFDCSAQRTWSLGVLAGFGRVFMLEP